MPWRGLLLYSARLVSPVDRSRVRVLLSDHRSLVGAHLGLTPYANINLVGRRRFRSGPDLSQVGKQPPRLVHRFCWLTYGFAGLFVILNYVASKRPFTRLF